MKIEDILREYEKGCGCDQGKPSDCKECLDAAVRAIKHWIDKEDVNPATGTLTEIGAKVGDVVELVSEISSDLIGCKAVIVDNGRAKLEDGGYFLPEYDEEYGRTYRIVSRASDAKPIGPVITETVTTKRIVPGVFGPVTVDAPNGDGEVYISIQDRLSRAELIAARDVFSQLIDAVPVE